MKAMHNKAINSDHKKLRCAPLYLCPVMAAVSAPRKVWLIWSGESPGMVRANHPPLPSVAPLAER